MLLLAVLAPGVLACGSSSSGDSEAGEPETVRGLIQEVKAKSLLELESLTIEDDSGVRWTFEARGKGFEGFTPSHLREHMVLALFVAATFHREDGVLVLDSLAD